MAKDNYQFGDHEKEFYIGTDAWTVILSTDTASDAHMMLTTEEYHSCVSCDDELELIWAIQNHRHDFVDEVNKALNNNNSSTAAPITNSQKTKKP